MERTKKKQHFWWEKHRLGMTAIYHSNYSKKAVAVWLWLWIGADFYWNHITFIFMCQSRERKCQIHSKGSKGRTRAKDKTARSKPPTSGNMDFSLISWTSMDYYVIDMGWIWIESYEMWWLMILGFILVSLFPRVTFRPAVDDACSHTHSTVDLNDLSTVLHKLDRDSDICIYSLQNPRTDLMHFANLTSNHPPFLFLWSSLLQTALEEPCNPEKKTAS